MKPTGSSMIERRPEGEDAYAGCGAGCSLCGEDKGVVVGFGGVEADLAAGVGEIVVVLEDDVLVQGDGQASDRCRASSGGIGRCAAVLDQEHVADVSASDGGPETVRQHAVSVLLDFDGTAIQQAEDRWLWLRFVGLAEGEDAYAGCGAGCSLCGEDKGVVVGFGGVEADLAAGVGEIVV